MATTKAQGPPGGDEARATATSNPGPKENIERTDCAAVIAGGATTYAEHASTAEHQKQVNTPTAHASIACGRDVDRDAVSTMQARYALIGWALLAVDGGFEVIRFGLKCGVSTIEEAEQLWALVADNSLADAAADQLDALRGECIGETEERACSA